MKTHLHRRILCILLLILCGLGSAWADQTTYTHAFKSKPSDGDNNLTSVTWTLSSASNLGNYNSNNYAGVQLGTGSKNGSATLTTKYDWGAETGNVYEGYTNIEEIHIWLNNGSGTISADVTIGGVPATASGTVTKNSNAKTDHTQTSKITYTPGANGNTGKIKIDFSTTNAGYFCAIEVVCNNGSSTTTVAVPTFSVAEGEFNEPFDLELSAETGASIYYTLDGTTPTTASTLYSAPIHIEQTTTVKAIASDETDVSAVASATYTLTDYDYTFALIPTDFDQWDNSYTFHTSDFEDYDTKISSDKIANPDSYSYPAIKGGYLIVSSISGKTIKAIRLICNQWGTYTQTIKLEVSSDSNNYTGTTPTTTSNNFDIENQSLPEGTTHVKFTFSNTSRQILLRTLYISFNNNEEEATVDSIAITGNSNDLYTCDDFSHEGITVTAYYDNETSENVTNKATYSGYDPNNLGEQTITVEYGGQTATYTVHVLSIANTAANAYSIAEAKDLIDAGKCLAETEVYVHGYVSAIDGEINDGALSYYISSTRNTTQEFKLLNGKYLNGDAFTAAPAVGDEVIVRGKLIKDGSTYALNENNEIVKTTPKFTIATINANINVVLDPDPAISTTNTDSYTITYTSSDATIVEVSNDGTTLTTKALGKATITATMAATANFYAATTEFTVNVTEELIAIGISGELSNKVYFIGDEINLDGLIVTALYADEDEVDVTDQVTWVHTFNSPLTTSDSDGTISATFEGEEAEIDVTITVKDNLTGITLNTENVKNEFSVGETFSAEGLIVTAHYLSGELEVEDTDFDDFIKFSGYDKYTPGTQTITVKYNDGDYDPVSAEYQITVVDPTIIQTDAYVLITSAAEMTDGVYVLATEVDGQGKLFALDGYVKSDPKDITIIDGEKIACDAITAEHEIILTAVDGVTNGYIVKYKGKYIGQDGTNNYFTQSETDPIVWDITMEADAEGELEIKDEDDPYYLYYNITATTLVDRFRWYKNKKTNRNDFARLKLYKKSSISEQSVTIGTEGVSSFCSRHALDFTDVEGVTAYQATLLNTESVHLEPIEGTVAANTGIMLMGTEGDVVNIPIVDEGDTYEENLLRPAFLGSTIPCTDAEYDRYVFGTVDGVKAFYRLTYEGITSTGNFAYLEILSAVNASSVIKIGDEEVPQPTDDPTLDQDDENAQTYNLLGIPVPRDFKGIVIRNGKKYFNK